MIKLGIECENLEDPKSRWGVGQITLNLLQEYADNLELQKKYKLYLYFKCKIPDDEVLKNPIFIKRLSRARSFNFFYHILMPLRAMIDQLDYMFFPAYMLPPLYLGKSIVMLTEDVHWEYKHGNLPLRYRLAYGLFTNWAAIKAHKILAISETSKKEVVRLYNINPDKIFVAHLGVNPKYEIRNQKQIQKILNSKSETVLNLENSNLDIVSNFDIRYSNFILYVGQMFPRRHAKETILAFKKIAPEFNDLKLILVGKDKYTPPAIDTLIYQTNEEFGSERIIHYDYLEKREDIEQLYAGARALIYVSDREAFGLPPMEALSFGVPPVIMDNELGHELFEDYAAYSKNGETDSIAEAMIEVLNNDQRTTNIRKNGPEFVKRYNWETFTDKFFRELS